MSTPSQKAKKTRAKNAREKAKQAEKLRQARARAVRAEMKLKAYKEGFKDGVNSLK